jgi:ribosomal protein S18 acetylase RimI-like enzyme
MDVRPATAADVPALAGALARAFHEDPVVAWCYGTADTRDRWSERFFRWQLARLIEQDVTWTTGDAAGAALWALPGRWREGPMEVLRLSWATVWGLGRRLPRTLRGLGQVEARHPQERHLYLAVLGVDPPLQGDGVGSALLEPGLELCDREALPAYLETATERNVAFYARHGFRVTGEVALPQGPTVWTMWREPR